MPKRAPGLVVSSVTGAGLADVRALLAPGVTAALVGPSGAGKSTLANALLGEDRLATGAGREGDAKGRHTTTWRELVRLPNGAWLLDTPGLRELALTAEADPDAVFEDIAELARRCKFSDCQHASEPGCVVRAAVNPERLASYQKLQREVAGAAVRADAAAARKQARAWGRMGKASQSAKRERLR